jgi:hypothetical protein
MYSGQGAGRSIRVVEARGRRLSWWIGGVAAAGVLVTHWLTYRLVVPHGHHRAELLHDTGHDHWPVVSAVALALFAASSLRVCALGLRRRPVLPFGSTAARLAAVQAAAWVGLEVGERAVAGHAATLDDCVLLLIGTAVQVAVAVLGATLVRVLHRAGAALDSRPFSPPRPRPQPAPRPVSAMPPRLLPLSGASGLRGPPIAQPIS